MRTVSHRAARPDLVWGLVLAIAAIRFALPVASTLFVPIGYTADELYYLACADHQAWGFVDHPPFSIAVLGTLRFLIGDSLMALRIVPALCESLAVIVTALLARELGGGRRAQVVAAMALAWAPMPLAIGLPFSMNPLEHLLWPLAALVMARLQNGAEAKWWLVLGALLGIALENKLSTLWFGAGLGIALLASPARSWLRTRWPWLAGGIAVAMLLPHIAWQVANDWPTLEFIHNNAVGREGIDAAVVMTSPMAFAVSQIFVMGPLMFPLWLLGLGYLLCSRDSREHRVLGWTFASVFMFVALSSRGSIYYLVGAFPIVLAAGGVAIEKFARKRAQYLPALACTVAVIQGLLVVPFVVPIVDPDRYLTLARNARQMIGAERDAAFLPPVYQWMLGAKELIDAVARVTYTLSESDRHNAGVLATTFGEAGALVHFGPAASLPPIIATHNNFWLWGTGALEGSVLIVVADADSPVLQQFSSCELADRVDCPQCEPRFGNREVFVCRDPVRPLSQVWAKLKDFS